MRNYLSMNSFNCLTFTRLFMNKFAIIFASAVVCTAVIGCKRTSSEVVYKPLTFKEEQEVKLTPISDEQLWGGPARIVKIDDLLAVVAYQQDSIETFLHVFNTSGQKIADYVTLGRGPKEIMSAHSVQNIGSTLHIFDAVQTKGVEVVLENHGNKATIKDVPMSADKIGLLETFKLNDNFLRYNPALPIEDHKTHPRITIETQNGDTLSSFSSSPFDGEDPMLRFHMDAMRYGMTVSPDMTKFAITYSSASVIEFFSTKDNTIKEEFLGYFYPPKFKVNGTDIEPEDDAIMAFAVPYASDSYVFVAYDGGFESSKNNLPFSKIIVFDWNGHAIKLLKTDYIIEAIRYSEEDSTIYAVIEDESRRRYLGKLKVDLK